MSNSYTPYTHLQNFKSTTAVSQNTGKGASTLILNQNNLVASDSTNSSFVYNFPSSVSFPNHKIAVQSITMYYSWVNISAALGNNTFSYNWIVAGVPTTFTITIPDSLMEISDINNLLQFTMIKNGHYLIDSASQNVYYAEFLVNVNLYSVDINTFPVPTALPIGWSVPVANPATGAVAWGTFPASKFNPIITLPANFNLIMGYVANFATIQNIGVGTNLSYHSSVSPQVQPNPTLFFSCNFVNNIYSNPNTIMYSITPSVAIGQQIIEKPPEFSWNNIVGTTASLSFNFRGKDQSFVKIIDPNMSIVLIIKEGD